uniref:Uncharacterized protein n=1 Tax=Mola mola TaxID=94237 RepID=A0A3Q4BDL0_MOLML
MSIDFDSAALQTQHDEEEYDQEDYAREQELQKLLTDLPDDMLDDSRDSSPELEYSTCSNKNTVHPRSTSQENYTYDDGGAQTDGLRSHPQSQTWSQQSQDHHFTQGDYTYCSVGTEKSTEASDFCADEYESKSYPQGTNKAVMFNGTGHGDDQNYRNHNDPKHHFQATYNPHLHAQQPKMFNSHATHREGQLDQLQREFLDSTQQTADREQLAQLQILNKAQQRQIEDLERKLEDTRRNMRYVEHQFAIVKDEKEDLAVSLKESGLLIEEAKEREVQMQSKLKTMGQQVKVLTDRDQEVSSKQRVAEAAVDSIKQQMLELCRSDTLSKGREQHDRDLAVMKEQHDAALLILQQKIDSTSQALNEQIEVAQRLREHVKQLEHQREEAQLERARVVNGLTHSLEESQQQCAKLLQTSSVQEMAQMQIKLQQAQSAKALSENMNKVLQDLADLKEQITLYESAVKHGVVGLGLSDDSENQLSQSCVDLGLKKTISKNGLHSTALAHLSDSKLPKDEALRLLRVEMQRCLGSLKGKRQKISQLHEELQLCQGQVSVLQTQLDEARLSSLVRETGQLKHLDINGDSQNEFLRLQEALEKKNRELKQNEEKLRSANVELCTKMREMIQELDQEKQEASARTERINQQFRDDVVNRVKTELMLEHDAQVEQLTAQHEQQVQQLQAQLSEANDKMLAVQECYISVCKEKDTLEESIRNGEKKERRECRSSEEAKEKHRETAEANCQADEPEAGGGMVTVKELDSKLIAQKQQLQLEADKAKHKAVEEARKQTQRELHKKHLEDMAKQVSGSFFVIALLYILYWFEDIKIIHILFLSLFFPETSHNLFLQTFSTVFLSSVNVFVFQVEGAVTRAYSRWIEDLTSLPEYQSSGTQRVEELQEVVADLQTQLDQVRREQAALLKAELAGARAAWNRDKQQEISIVQALSEQVYQTKLQEQRTELEQALQQAREDQTVGVREEEWRSQQAEKEEAQRQLMRRELLAELQTGLQGTEDIRTTSGDTLEGTITQIIRTSCQHIVNSAVSQAKEGWRKVSYYRLSLVLRSVVICQSFRKRGSRTPHTQTISHTAVNTHREPTPGSEAEEQRGVCSRPLFSELRQRQQDSGFDSPYYNQK